MGKPTICIGENKGADQLRGNREADQRLCFRYSDSTIPLLLKSKISSFYLFSVLVQVDLCRTCSETTLLVFPTRRLKGVILEATASQEFLLTCVFSSMAATVSCLSMLKECKKFPPNTRESLGVYTAWIQPITQKLIIYIIVQVLIVKKEDTIIYNCVTVIR